MDINFIDIKDTFLGWCIISASTHKDKNILNVWPDWKPGDGIDAKFIVNGVELPLVESFDELKAQVDRMVAEKSYELISEKFSDLTDTVESLERKIKRTAKERLGITLDDEW
jgi:hypothetical protein